MKVFRTLTAGCLVAVSAAASAHEFWLEPTAFAVPAGGHIGVYVCNGSGYEGWSLPRDPRRIEEFVAVGPDGSHPVLGLDGSEPAGLVRFAAPGGYVIAYRSNRAMTVQPDEKFDEYLREKGLDAVLARRMAEGHRGGRVRESYSRYAKTLIAVGAPADLIGSANPAKSAGPGQPAGPVDRALGLPLEVVADQDLFTGDAAAGNVAHVRTFRLLYLGKPLAGALVTAMRPGTADSDITARTDRDGRVRVKLDKRGAWRIAAIHMVAPPADVDADWDSLWASLTFELPSSTPAAAMRVTKVPRDERCRNQLAPTSLRAQR